MCDDLKKYYEVDMYINNEVYITKAFYVLHDAAFVNWYQCCFFQNSIDNC